MIALAAVFAAAMLSGCAPTSALVEPTISTSPTATPTASPTPAPPVWTVAFGGECDTMLSPSQRSSVLGVDTVDADVQRAEYRKQYGTVAFPDKTPGPEGTAGGLSCGWAEQGGNGRWWGILALPASLADPQTVAALAEPTCAWNYDTRVCRLGVTAGGLWFLVTASPMEESEAAPADTMRALIEAAADNAPSAPAAVPATVTAQRWPIVPCAELGERMKLAEVLGEGYWSGYWEGSRQAEDDVFEYAGVQQFCQYGTRDGSTGGTYYIISVTSQPGGAWMWGTDDEAVGESVTVTGTQKALRILSGDPAQGDDILATDGTNLIRVNVGAGQIAPDITGRAIAALAQG
ncbi:hypothetical protein JVX92_04665 [Microbacterium hominis]|uniref:hypothetical protein n=1 Tax=Microbacterium hominis TaxID=162426 RepID=UPI001965FD36|nr:hypothetical protein [Microbacterium hominis]QRY42295.1 hypothetical protein JVX92_04665 [Microbacterium hominis]